MEKPTIIKLLGLKYVSNWLYSTEALPESHSNHLKIESYTVNTVTLRIIAIGKALLYPKSEVFPHFLGKHYFHKHDHCLKDKVRLVMLSNGVL